MSYKTILSHYSDPTFIRSSLAIIGVIVVIGLSIVGVMDRHKSPATNTNVSLSQPIVIDGSTKSVTQLTQRDVQLEESIDNSSDSQIQQSITTVNKALNNLAGAYNASKL